MNFHDLKIVERIFWQNYLEFKKFETVGPEGNYLVTASPYELLKQDGSSRLRYKTDDIDELTTLLDVAKSSRKYIDLQLDNGWGFEYLLVTKDGNPQLLSTERKLEQHTLHRFIIEHSESYPLATKIIEQAKTKIHRQ
jgi:hypothetical protein